MDNKQISLSTLSQHIEGNYQAEIAGKRIAFICNSHKELDYFISKSVFKIDLVPITRVQDLRGHRFDAYIHYSNNPNIKDSDIFPILR